MRLATYLFVVLGMMLSILTLPGTQASAEDVTTQGVTRYYVFDTKNGSADDTGYARACGFVVWWETRRGFNIGSSGCNLDDVCPGNGFRAQLDIRIHYRRGDPTYHQLAKDADGCDSASTSFYDILDRRRVVTRVTVILCETYGILSCRSSDGLPRERKQMDNPLVG